MCGFSKETNNVDIPGGTTYISCVEPKFGHPMLCHVLGQTGCVFWGYLLKYLFVVSDAQSAMPLPWTGNRYTSKFSLSSTASSPAYYRATQPTRERQREDRSGPTISIIPWAKYARPAQRGLPLVGPRKRVYNFTDDVNNILRNNRPSTTPPQDVYIRQVCRSTARRRKYNHMCLITTTIEGP